jgi:type II secretory pathway component PulF
MVFAQNYIVWVKDKLTRREFELEVTASSDESLLQELEDSYIVLSFQKKTTELKEKIDALFHSSVSESDILRVLTFLAQSLQRGVVLKKSLEFLLVSEEKMNVKRLLKQLLARLEGQFSSYYDIFKAFPEHFDHTFLGIVKAGEQTATLPENILQYIEDKKKMQEQKDMILSVLFKRGMMFAVVFLVSLVITLYVIPQFSQLFQDKTKLPSLFLMMLNISDFLHTYGGTLLFSLLVSGVILFLLLTQSYHFQKMVHKLFCKLPLFGGVTRTFYTCQYLYFTGTLLMKNVNYIKIMDILIDQIKNIPFKEVFEIMRENVLKGIELKTMLRNSEFGGKAPYKKIPRGYLLPSLLQAIEMGTATGDMGKVLYDAFLSYEVILHNKIAFGIKVFDRVFYSGIVLVMIVLFAAMGSAMIALYQNASTMV